MSDVDQQVSEEPTEVSPPKVFLPGEIFYTERLDIPAGLSIQEVEAAVETQLEAHAPFPIEQLNFGTVFSPEKGQALMYAVYRDTLQVEEDFETFPESRYPCFLPFLSFEANEPCILTGVTEEHLCLLVYDAAGLLPAEVHCITLDEAPDDMAYIEKVRADLLRDLPWIQLAVYSKIFTWQKTEQNWKNERTFLSTDTAGDLLAFQMNAVEASMADVRDRDLKEKALSAAKWNQILWLTTLGSAAGLAVVAILAMVNWIWSFSIDSKVELVKDRQSQVQAIEAKERNLQVFESGSAAQLQPLAMLDIINRVRPDGLYFSEVRAFEGKKLQVDGMAENNGTALINQFRDELNKLDSLESVSVEITRINQGIAYFFRANVAFNELELADVGSH